MSVLALGEVLVEVMRPERGTPLSKPGSFRGPFASGAPLIFASAAGRLGAKTSFAGVVGDDAFGALCLEHLRAHGVTSHLRTAKTHTTGVAFVAYDEAGGREFLFHFKHAAAALLSPEDALRALPDDLSWLHITGSSLAGSETMRRACERAVEVATARKATVSFDPNLRLELMDRSDIGELCGFVLKRAQVVLPSGAEAALLTGASSPEEGCRVLAETGKTVLLKRGADGCTLFAEGRRLEVPSIRVEERDPTGAGDCFAAGLAVARTRGLDWPEAARFANVVGALSVRAFGPAEGVPSLEEVEEHL